MNQAQSTQPLSSPTNLNSRDAKLADMILGYLDGLNTDLQALPKSFKSSAAYKHGWLNGRDDRLGSPRDTAEVLDRRAAMILGS